MAYVPNVNWFNDAPPGFEADEMIRMQLGIADAGAVADEAKVVAAQATADIGQKADKSQLAVNVRDFGAAGDNIADDTVAIQSAIDAAYATGRSVHLPAGNYRTTATILLPELLHLTGTLSDTRVFTQSTYACSIKTDAALAFAPADSGSNVSLILSDIYLKNVYQSGPATLFGGGVDFRATRIHHITASNYDTVIEGTLRSVSSIRDSYFYTVSDCFLRGPMFDSEVSNNYINGNARTHNPTCFELTTWSAATVTDNFIDFFKTVFDLRANTRNVIVANNRIERCFRVFDGTAETARTITGTTITGNVFYAISSDATLPYFDAADDDMLTGEWCIIHARQGIAETSFTDNQLDQVDVAMKVRRYPVRSFYSAGNHYWNTATRIDYSVTNSGQSGEQEDIYIEELDNQRVATLPSASITSTSGDIVSFDKQRLIYSGVPVFNDAGTWKLYDGTTAV